MEVDILPKTLSIFDNTVRATSFEESLNASSVFNDLRSDIVTATDTTEGQKLIQKFFFLGKTVTTEGTFYDMVKIAWRMVKEAPETPVRKISLFFISIGTMCTTLPATEEWRPKLEAWLGRQLTIGGKGCAGEGEGSVMDRLKRFFSTPYLHDFD